MKHIRRNHGTVNYNIHDLANMDEQSKRELVGLSASEKDKQGQKKRSDEENEGENISGPYKESNSQMYRSMNRENSMGNGISYAAAFNKKDGGLGSEIRESQSRVNSGLNEEKLSADKNKNGAKEEGSKMERADSRGHGKGDRNDPKKSGKDRQNNRSHIN